jgi:hypothetical protein
MRFRGSDLKRGLSNIQLVALIFRPQLAEVHFTGTIIIYNIEHQSVPARRDNAVVKDKSRSGARRDIAIF